MSQIVELLWFSDCPNHPAARAMLGEVIAEVAPGTPIRDIDATDRARGYFKGFPPSSPSVGLLRNGELVYMLQRHQIEGREALQIAADLKDAFDRFCVKEKVS